MAKCENCSKAGQSGNNVSHSNRKTRRRWFANVQRTTVVRNGKPRRMYLCTRCLRTENKAAMRG